MWNLLWMKFWTMILQAIQTTILWMRFLKNLTIGTLAIPLLWRQLKLQRHLVATL